jgi:phosphatidylserine/phosphatidylglycerophosphate/cardiolipin synthase-like enzyme
MSPGRRPSAAEARRRPLARELVVLEPAERRTAMLRIIGGARRRLVLSLFRCDDFEVLDALAAALERGVAVHALLTKRAKGGRKRLKKLWEALEEMGAVVSWYADPVVKYHAKYLVADEGPALVTTLNPTRKCFTRTWDAVLVTHDDGVVRSLLHLFEADAAGRPPSLGRRFSRRLIVGPEQARLDMHALFAGARHSIRILDHKLSDPDVVALLRERRAAGVTVSVLGAALAGPLEPHGKLIIIDEERAVIGSLALSTLSLDFRREVALVVHDPAAVQRLNIAYQDLVARAGPLAHRLPGDQP